HDESKTGFLNLKIIADQEWIKNRNPDESRTGIRWITKENHFDVFSPPPPITFTLRSSVPNSPIISAQAQTSSTKNLNPHLNKQAAALSQQLWLPFMTDPAAASLTYNIPSSCYKLRYRRKYGNQKAQNQEQPAANARRWMIQSIAHYSSKYIQINLRSNLKRWMGMAEYTCNVIVRWRLHTTDCRTGPMQQAWIKAQHTKDKRRLFADVRAGIDTNELEDAKLQKAAEAIDQALTAKAEDKLAQSTSKRKQRKAKRLEKAISRIRLRNETI
ncbi:13157_t:CDS:2, partial [Ambispora gerdemannii]